LPAYMRIGSDGRTRTDKALTLELTCLPV